MKTLFALTLPKTSTLSTPYKIIQRPIRTLRFHAKFKLVLLLMDRKTSPSGAKDSEVEHRGMTHPTVPGLLRV